MLSEIIAGDYYEVPLQYSDYPASDGWTVRLLVRGPSVLTVTATSDGDTHVITLPSTTTAALLAGLYQYSVTATKDGRRYTVESGFIDIKPDLNTATAKVISLQARVYAIEAVLDNRITDDIESYSIAGRSVTNIPIEQLLQLRAMAYRELAVLTGQGLPRRTVPIQFTGVQ